MGIFLLDITNILIGNNKNNMEPDEIEMLISVSDPDGVWAQLQDMGDTEGMAYIENKYFN